MSVDTSLSGPAAAPSWRDAGERDHFVQFYEHETVLMESLSGFVRQALESGAAAIVIATRTHLDELERWCAREHVNLAAAAARGQYVPLEAAETLGRIMVRGWPQREQFLQTIEPVLAAAERGFGRVVAFGEMVSLLWKDGRYSAAIHLEGLWNDLAAKREFALFCAYSTQNWDAQVHAIPFHGVCSQHTLVVGANAVGGAAADVTQLQQKAAVLEREIRARRVAEGALARREQELSEFLDNAVVGIQQVSPEGTIQ